MTDRKLAFGGSGLLAAGLFTPTSTMPIIGNVTMLNVGNLPAATVILALAVGSAVLAAKDRVRDILWTGLAATALLLFLVVRLLTTLSFLRQNAIASFAQDASARAIHNAFSAQLQWGWIVLFAGAGLLLYAGYARRRRAGGPLFGLGDRIGGVVVALSALLFLVEPALYLFWRVGSVPQSPATAATAPAEDMAVAADDEADSDPGTLLEQPVENEKSRRDAAAYISQNLRVYDLAAKYYDSVLDGRVPGVRFKIKNSGDRTLNRVKVRVVFHDAGGNPIAEEEYLPVFVTEYDDTDEDKPLRPNYIWQEDAGKFYAAKNVPSEWSEGKATATVTEIRFAPPSLR